MIPGKLFHQSGLFIKGQFSYWLLLLSACFLFSTGSLLSQEITCTAYIPSLPGVGTDCIDVTQPGQVTSEFILPSNVTSVQTEGLRICGPGTLEIGVNPLTVIFVVDQSGSMYGLDHTVNDPEFDAPKAVKLAMENIRDNIPGSHIGYLGFAGGICDGTNQDAGNLDRDGEGPKWAARGTPASNTVVYPLQTNDPVNMNTLFAQTDYTAENYFFSCGHIGDGGGTYYWAPFDKAQEMFEATRAQGVNNKEIIIFVTDGQPERDPNKKDWEQMVDDVEAGTWPTLFPRTYAVFIGDENEELSRLAEGSGGSLIQVEGAAQISDTLSSIVENIQYSFNYETTVTFSIDDWTHRELAQMDTTGTGLANDGEVRLEIEDPIPLDQGNPIITVTSNPGGVDHSHQFTLSLTGDPITELGAHDNPPPNPFQTVCSDGTNVKIDKPFLVGDFTFSIQGQGVVYRSNRINVQGIKIYNTLGSLILSSPVNGPVFRLEATGLKKGLYLVEILHQGGKVFTKAALW